MEFRRHCLKNGLEIVAECNDDAHSTAVGFFVRAGSRDETDGIAGVSHFLEHMMFKGTPTRTADDVNREFDEIGAHYNAFTNEENTAYYAAVLPEYQDAAVALLADILRPSLREDDFDTEKKVIIEEIHMYDDQPPFGADEKCRAAYFGSHPLGRSVLGTVQSVTDLSVDAMRTYFRRRYSPTNITLAVAGRVDFDGLIRGVKRCCGSWEPVVVERAVTPATPCERFDVISKEIASQQYVLQLSDGPTASDGDRHAVKLLATILGDDSGSRLYWELVDPGLVEHASLSHCEYEGAGLMMSYMSCEPEMTTENLQRIVDVYRRAAADGLTSAELEQAKSKLRSRIVLSGERPRGRLFAIACDWVYRHEYRTIRDDLDVVAAVTLDEVEAVLAKYPLLGGTTVTIGPSNDVQAPR